jgi:hypothetical protein
LDKFAKNSNAIKKMDRFINNASRGTIEIEKFSERYGSEKQSIVYTNIYICRPEIIIK